MSIPDKDRAVLRDLAKALAEIAALPVQAERAELWRRLNGMDPVRPMVWCNVAASCWSEFFNGDELQCTDEWARRHEVSLRQGLYHWEHFKDDRGFDGTIASPIAIHDTGWGIAEDSTRPDHWYGARRYNTIIEADADPEIIGMPEITVDPEATERNYERLCDVYDGILTVEKRGRDGFWFSIMDEFIKWRGIENVMVDMVDRPEWVHAVMERMTDGWLSRLDQLESQGLLSLNNGNQRVGSAAFGYTDELPQEDFDGERVRTIDMWGHATTQIFSEVSPAMHDEFALTYEKRFLERFGLANYGCCEPLHLKVDIAKTIPNLRRLSMSPWIDVEVGAEAIGRDCIFSWKPNPAILGGEDWFPELARDHIRDTLEKTRDCVVEIIMKDLHTCRGEPHRIAEWCKIASELADQNW
ncbi:MAG: hypothetical protein PVH68_12325 [Armatimonadota bacterium]